MQEQELRAALVNRLASDKRAEGSRIVHELAMPLLSARVDLAVIGARIIGYEIKTAKDTLIRLPQQSEAYGKVFERMFLVAETRHIARSLATLPDWWGVIEARESGGGVRWTQRRGSKLNPSVDLKSLVELLWRDELVGELQGLGLRKGVASASRAVLTSRLVGATPEKLSTSALKSRVRYLLTHREDWRAA
jgi:hypothetical protein